MGFKSDFEPRSYRLANAEVSLTAGKDLRDGSIYVYDESIVLAVRVALATGRPLLLLGPAGCGKSSLAAYVSREMNWNYYEQVVTSRTRAQDLLWSFDVVRRLRDAQAKKTVEKPEYYVEPKVLWWAFDSSSAQRRGAAQPTASIKPPITPGTIRGNSYPSVILIDEIDKADPDVPNDLLVAIGSQKFVVDELAREISAVGPILCFITSNNERSLPSAFLRRCVIHRFKQPTKDRLLEIAKSHFPNQARTKAEMFAAVAEKVIAMRADESEGTQSASIAEFLDAVRACLHFELVPDESPIWKAIEAAVLVKDKEPANRL